MRYQKINKPCLITIKHSNLSSKIDPNKHNPSVASLVSSWAILEQTVFGLLAEILGIKDPIMAEIFFGNMQFRQKLNKLSAISKYLGLPDEIRELLTEADVALEGPTEIRNKISHLPVYGVHKTNKDTFYLLAPRGVLTSLDGNKNVYSVQYSDLKSSASLAQKISKDFSSTFTKHRPLTKSK